MVILTLPLRLVVVAALDLTKVEGALEALGGGIPFRVSEPIRDRSRIGPGLFESRVIVEDDSLG